ncbi:serine O-acetyltransferase EpsC [Streptomyces sp. NBC_00388]|uniref:serine O-acetyltransferase EpsC n=1 Tax=Streptomyces sp. NBC_00388 TaxID=2975735 RepID=UPI002E1F633D
MADPADPAEPGLLRTMWEDLDVVVARDPSIRNRREGLLHAALPALWAHRVAHRLHRRGLRLPARLVAAMARRATSVEIHPGARIGRRVFIDHGAAVVIGETAVIGADSTLYHQVTLGAVGWWSDVLRPDGERRHPVVGHHVVLGTGATVLGPVTIGDHAVVGAQALVHRDVPAGARVLAPTAVVHTAGGARRPVAENYAVTASAGSW